MAARKNALEAALRQAVKDLDALGCRWALVGGLAVSARAEPRTTRDVDVAIAARGDSEAEHLVAELVARGYTPEALIEQTEAGRLATVRLRGRSGLLLDLLFASSGIEDVIVSAAERIVVLPRLRAPVASVGHLIAMKVLARDDRARPQDLDDIRQLLAVAAPPDLRAAKAALALIEKRGFQRGKRLGAALAAVLRARKTRR